MNLYRIIQEITHNTLKHAQARLLDISISSDGKNLLLQTQDDGIGFNFTEKKQIAQGLGLMSLQSRVELLGGHLNVFSQPGNGTRFEIEIPL